MVLEFEYSVYIGRPVDVVWDALTTKSIIDRYYMAPVFSLELELGGVMSYGADSALILGRILELVPTRKLTHSFHFEGSADPKSVVSYELEAIGERMCLLRITHSGFEEENQTFSDISGGWPVIASSLKTLLETGAPLPWPVG